jgi:choline dehydrogenase-like flavoprotein
MNVENYRRAVTATTQEYDVIVVGTGPAGATIAAQLAKARKKVLMLERGAYHPRWILGKQVSSPLLYDKMGFSPLGRERWLPVLSPWEDLR